MERCQWLEPRRIWWARPRKLCALERPGGGGRSHRPERREAEIAYLSERGVRLVVSMMRTRHNLPGLRGGRARAGTTCRCAATEDGAEALEELLPLLRRELRRRGAVALHGDRHTDFVAAVCAAHLHEARGADPAEALARAAARGSDGHAARRCALLGRRRGGGGGRSGIGAREERRASVVGHRHAAAGSKPSSVAASVGAAARRTSAASRPAAAAAARSESDAVADHERRPSPSRSSAVRNRLRLRLADDLGRALGRVLHGRQRSRPCPARGRPAAGRWGRAPWRGGRRRAAPPGRALRRSS